MMNSAHAFAEPNHKRPLILVAPRWQVMERTLEVPEQLAPEEVMASVFADAILAAGGLPLMMPLTDDDDVIETMLSMCDGVAVPGGQDVNPARWGADSPYDESLLCDVRDEFEFKLVHRVLELDKPLFATCRGMQLLNVVMGGTLCMDVPGIAPLEGTGLWRHAMVLNDPAHPVEVQDGTLLARCVGGAGLIQANSSHHCCVDKIGEGVRLVARATDGIPSTPGSASPRTLPYGGRLLMLAAPSAPNRFWLSRGPSICLLCNRSWRCFALEAMLRNE